MKYCLGFALLVFSCAEKPRFELLSSSNTGIDFVNEVIETDSLHVMNFEYIYNGAGVGVVDLNNDGLLEIIFTGNQVSPKVYLNKGDFRFEDITSGFPGIGGKRWYSGISVVDINNDGFNDIYLTCTAYEEAEARRNQLWVNLGVQEDGTLLFEEQAARYGIDDDSYGVHAAFFDYDLDGDLDLYLLNNFVTERLSASYREKILDGSAISNDDLYMNIGDSTFVNVTIEAGILYEGFGLGLAIGDVNKDFYPDIYVSNDYVSNDLLYINQKDGTFTNEIAKYMSYQTKSSMGNDMADINNDGYPDIFTLDMMPEKYDKKKQTINGFSYIYYIYDNKFGYEHQYLRNMLHLHNGFLNGDMLPYSEIGQRLGIYQTEWSWSPLFADYDNDGDNDLLVTNGYPKDLTDKDWTRYKAEVYGFVADEQHVMSRAPAVKAYNYAFENQGGLNFKKVSKEWFEPVQSYSYGAAFADLDNDGDLDYVVNNVNDAAFMYKNNTIEKDPGSTNYIRLKLAGSHSNHDALGAKVELWENGTYQFKEKYLSRGYVSSVDPTLHFGVANSRNIDSIKVIWPDGRSVSTLYGVEVNQLLEFEFQDAGPMPHHNPASSHSPMFKLSEGIIDYEHQQEDFVDFIYKQNIMPHKFSQIGPIMSKGDINQDGLEDIVIGATNSLPTMIYLNKGDYFICDSSSSLSQKKDFSEADLVIIDFDMDGDNDVIAVAGGYENQNEEDYKHYIYRNEGNSFVQEQLPISAFSASVIKPCDYDQDGDPDLFIGARVKKDMYPLAADSWILINDEGKYLAESCMGFNLGMVTDAVWSDYDGDGWKDLLVARELNSVAILKNKQGKGLGSQILEAVEAKHGYWYSITSADFDNDGDDDYLLGNLGNNHRFHISDKYPLKVYAVDMDRNGTLDPIASAFWEDENGEMTEYPINYLDELVAQMPAITKKYSDYKSFSYATINDILDEAVMERVVYEFIMNTTSSCVLWNDNGDLKWELLPELAQLSPIKKVVVADINSDDIPDAILGGNDYTFDVGTGYFDANKGLVLASSKGKALSDALMPSETGLLLQGMVESMLILSAPDPLLAVGFNRQKVETFKISQ